MYAPQTVAKALDLDALGRSSGVIARELGMDRSTVRAWLKGATPRTFRDPTCEQCNGPEHDFGALTATYVYLRGLYLGDGCIATHRRRVYRLRIVLDVKYPLIIDEAAAAIRAVSGRSVRVGSRPQNCVEVSSYWRSWPCLFPRLGPGKKHLRPIVLTPWQQQLVNRWPQSLLRGLIQSDGCRFTNTGRNWICPQYSFSNKSADIKSIFCDACERRIPRRSSAESESHRTHMTHGNGKR